MKPRTSHHGRCYVELGLAGVETYWTIHNLKRCLPRVTRASLRIWMSGLFYYTPHKKLELFLIDREDLGLKFPRFIAVHQPVIIHVGENQLANGEQRGLTLDTGYYELQRMGSHGAVTITIRKKLAIAS